MRRILYYMLILISTFTYVSAELAQSFIILSSDENKTNIEIEHARYEKILSQNRRLQKAQMNEHASIKIEEKEGVYFLKVGPYTRGDNLALAYLELRSRFFHSFILENPQIETVTQEKVKYVEKKVFVEKEDQTLWVALFGLGIIGILSLFLSSDQLKNLRIRHKKIQERQNDIEKKQSLLLEKMGEKIKTVALKTVDDEKRLIATPLHEIDTQQILNQLENLKKHDEELLRTTYEMIDFLKIKSGNIVIKQEPFQLSNMLHKLTNMAAPYLKGANRTLHYNIDLDLTRYLVGDTARIYQILHNLLSDIFDNKDTKDVILNIKRTTPDRLVFCIENKGLYLTPIQIEDLFVPTSWEEIQKSKKEFSFFFINELVSNMKGTFYVTSNEKRGTIYELTLPYIEDANNKSKKEALKHILSGKKALLIDSDIEKTKALKEILDSFGIDVIFKSSENLALYKPDMSGLSFIIIKEKDVTKKVFEYLKSIANKQTFKVVIIFDIFKTEEREDRAVHIADAVLYTPLIVGDVEEVLKELCLQSTKKKKLNIRQEMQGFSIVDAPKVSREDFNIFGTKKVLLVEDDQVSQQVTKSILNAASLDVYSVENGVEALIFLAENPDTDIVLMDINMPVMDGYDATRKIRENELLKEIPVVAVTGLGFYNELEQMIFAGIDGCVIKPYKVGQLYRAFEKFLDTDEFADTSNTISNRGQGNRTILDIDKGINYVRSEQYYKEIVAQILEALDNSDTLVEEMIYNGKAAELRAFCVDAVGLSATIGATQFVNLLHKMLLEMKNDEYAFLVEYIFLYQEEWKRLKQEIRSYLIS